MTQVELKRLDDDFQASFEPGEFFLGRGPLLKIDATNISRKHAQLYLGEDGDLKLTCLHRNPIFVKQEGIWKELGKDDQLKLNQNDEIKFLEKTFHFKIYITCPDNKSDDGHINIAEKDQQISNEAEEILAPVHTGIKVTKKRKLPEWLQNVSPSKKSKTPSTSRDKVLVAKNNQKPSDIYTENVKLINPAWSSEEISEPQDEKTVNENHTTVAELTSCADSVADSFLNSSSQLSLAGTSDPNTSKRKVLTPMKKISENTGKENIPSQPESSVNVSPAVVAPRDLIDSDEEPEKENLKQKVKENDKKVVRPSCSFGSACYRKNPLHKAEEAHPGDEDYRNPDDIDAADDDRPECEYGTNCYRKNPDHRKQFKHSVKPQPKREAKATTRKKNKKQKKEDSDDSFIDDEEDDWEPVDDSDEDEDWVQPADDTDEDEDWGPEISPEFEL